MVTMIEKEITSVVSFSATFGHKRSHHPISGFCTDVNSKFSQGIGDNGQNLGGQEWDAKLGIPKKIASV